MSYATFFENKDRKRKGQDLKENFLDHKVQPNAAKETDTRPYETDLSNPLRCSMGRHTTSSTRPQVMRRYVPTMPDSTACVSPLAIQFGTSVSPNGWGAGAM